jgi:hypothetical protein
MLGAPKLALARSTARIGALSHMPLIPRLWRSGPMLAPWGMRIQ